MINIKRFDSVTSVSDRCLNNWNKNYFWLIVLQIENHLQNFKLYSYASRDHFGVFDLTTKNQ